MHLGLQFESFFAGYAQSYDQVERDNRETKVIVGKYNLKHKGSWFDLFLAVLTSLRIVFDCSHGYTPYFITYL